tara:strand:- start:764 stop:997 length:234 start_codon:yes stop_codon:yes gene_type:complete
MTTLLDTIDIFSTEIWQQDREAAVDLGVVIDCLREDLEDPADDAAAANWLTMIICDDRPLLEPWVDAIIAEIKKAAA